MFLQIYHWMLTNRLCINASTIHSKQQNSIKMPEWNGIFQENYKSNEITQLTHLPMGKWYFGLYHRSVWFARHHL